MATLDSFSNEIIKALKLYGSDIEEGIKKETKKLALDGIKRLKATSPKRTGGYSRGWKYKKRGNTYVLYNQKYRLTHLLEKRHRKKNGKGFTEGIPHIKPVELQIIRDLTEYVERAAIGDV